jgi:phosphatidylinositol-3-phosphatase
MPVQIRRPRPLRLTVAGLGVTCCVLAAGCGPATAPASSASPAGRSSAGAPQGARRLAKILVIMDENHSIGQVFPSRMPYLWGLARRYGRASAWSDIGHPSLPNYLAIFGGSAFNEPPDCLPGPGCSYPGPSVFGQAIAKGETARSYEESMPARCDRTNSGDYDANHNPWAYFPAETSRCQANDVPSGTVTSGPLTSDVRRGTLPNVGLITPNLIDDAHNGTLADADRFLRTWMPVLMSGPDWRSGRLAIVVAFDEGETTEQVPVVVMAPGVSGVVVRRPLNHYALTRLIDQVIGVAPLRQAAGAPNIAPLFGLQAPPAAAGARARAMRYRAGDPLRYRYLTGTSDGRRTRPYGYNLVDTGPNRNLIDALPAGQRALVWIGSFDKATCSFALSDAMIRRLVGPLAADPKVAGYYLDDEADDALPAYGGHCPQVAAQVADRSRLVHRLAPGAFTYEVVTEPGNFAAFARATDVLGADPYPCPRGGRCDWSRIPRYIAALRAAHVARYWGVLQAFSAYVWRFPAPAELLRMIRQWERSDWQGEQTFAWSYAGHSLARQPALLAVLRALNSGTIRK